MSEIGTILNSISQQAREIGLDVEAYMNPPAAIGEINRAASTLTFSLPSNVVDFYQWKNGVRLEGQTCEYRMFPRFVFPSLKEAVETTKALVAAADDPEIQWHKSWFALATDLAGDYLAIQAGQESGNYGTIFAIQQAVDPYPAFWSFEAMLLSILECYKSGAYFLDADGFLDEQSELSDPIYRAHNYGLSPLHLIPKEKLLEDIKRAKRKFELEMRPDLIDKLRELAGKSGINTDDW